MLRDHSVLRNYRNVLAQSTPSLTLSYLIIRVASRIQIPEVKHLFQSITIDVDAMWWVLRSCEELRFRRIYLQTDSHGLIYNPVWNRRHSFGLLSQSHNVVGEFKVSDPIMVSRLNHSKLVRTRYIIQYIA